MPNDPNTPAPGAETKQRQPEPVVTERVEWVVQRLRPGGCVWQTATVRAAEDQARLAMEKGRASWGPDWRFRLLRRHIRTEETVEDQ